MKPPLATLLQEALRGVPDYPKPGILFQDITPVLGDSVLFGEVVGAMAAPFKGTGITHVVGIEARGFILGGAVADRLGCGFVPLRKPGKLPWETVQEVYELEYGTDTLEGHRDALPPGSRALIVDDVLATGGTAQAAGALVRQLGGDLAGWSFLLAIDGLEGRGRLREAPVEVLLTV